MVGAITQMTSDLTADGYWDYAYDDRYRLTRAEHRTSGGALEYQYSYTYDAGDNMVSKAVYDAGTSTTDATSYTCNNANEMTALVNGGTTVSYGYDAIGRVTSKSDGTYTATYTYGPAGMLSTVTSTFPDEGNVTYVTAASGQRRQRTDSSGTTKYRWHGWSVLHEEDSSGNLQRTYVGHTLAHVDGTNPATGAYTYYFQDHLGSTRRLRAQDKSSIAKYEYTPYGEVYASSGTTSATTDTYAMLAWDDAAQMYFAPFRDYMPEAGRWAERDPAGDGLNGYLYVGGNPVEYNDPLGLCREKGESFGDCRRRMTAYEKSRMQPLFGGVPAVLTECGESAATAYIGRKIAKVASKMSFEYTLPRSPGTWLADFLLGGNSATTRVASYSGRLMPFLDVAVPAATTLGASAATAVVSYSVGKHVVAPYTNAMVSCAFSCD